MQNSLEVTLGVSFSSECIAFYHRIGMQVLLLFSQLLSLINLD
jgi:hypothetical protein